MDTENAATAPVEEIPTETLPASEASPGAQRSGPPTPADLADQVPASLAGMAAELEKTRAALKAANAESAARRKKLEAYERSGGAEEEVARLKSELATARAEADTAKANARAAAIRHAVETAAAGLSFQDPADALTLADLTAVQVDDAGNVTGAAEAVKALAGKRPYLLKPAGDALGTPRRMPAQRPPAEPQKAGAPLVRL